jgi:hypothetical protein
MPIHTRLFFKTDPTITDEAAGNFVGRITSHIPLGASLEQPLVVGNDPAEPGVPSSLLDGSGALWSLPAGEDGSDRMVELDGGRYELTRYRNGNEVSREIIG